MGPTRPPPKRATQGAGSPQFNDFISRCLVKSPAHRKAESELVMHPFVKGVGVGAGV